jgi:hypothetical protein
MEVVVFGLKEYHVHQSHGHVQSWMMGPPAKHLGWEAVQPAKDFCSFEAKRSKDGVDLDLIVLSLMSFAIRHVGGMQNFRARGIFIESLINERFEIQQVTCIFLN